jgi:ribosomal protein S18 acetylase RimI-like enzyme
LTGSLDHILREATEEDSADVAAVVDAAYRPYIERIGIVPRPMTEDYSSVIRERRILVAESGGSVVGVLVLDITDEGFLVDNVAVDPGRQRMGLGRALLERAELEARRAGFASIYLYTHEDMSENIALYSRLGYVEFHRRPVEDFYLVFMRKTLVPLQ